MKRHEVLEVVPDEVLEEEFCGCCYADEVSYVRVVYNCDNYEE